MARSRSGIPCNLEAEFLGQVWWRRFDNGILVKWMEKEKIKTREYWQKNIGKFGKSYADISEEEFDTGWLIDRLYRTFIMPIESRLMIKRYKIVMECIDRYVKPGMIVADIGCGTGVFTIELLNRGAKVKAVDYANHALKLTRSLVEQRAKKWACNVEYLLLDVTEKTPPRSNMAIAIGVTPYIIDINTYYDNILSTTDLFYCLILDSKHWANRLRRLLPFLNVRKMQFYDSTVIDQCLARNGFRLLKREPFATGYFDMAERENIRS